MELELEDVTKNAKANWLITPTNIVIKLVDMNTGECLSQFTWNKEDFWDDINRIRQCSLELGDVING